MEQTLAYPETFQEMLTSGTSWDIDDAFSVFSLTYKSPEGEKVKTYTQRELDAIDERILQALLVARSYVDGEALQVVLKSSYKLWTTTQHKLVRGNRVDYVVRIVGAAEGTTGMTKLSFHYHALYGINKGLPVSKGTSIVAIEKEVSLAAVEAAFPGFEKAYTIAAGLGLSPFETGKFCMQHLGLSGQSVTPLTDVATLPDNIGYI